VMLSAGLYPSLAALLGWVHEAMTRAESAS
jgi:hypothetical protein